MKTTHLIPIAMALLALPAQAAERPGFIDIDGLIARSAAQPEVNVNLPSFLLAEMAEGFADQPENPFAAAGIDIDRIIKDVRSIRLVVFEQSQAAGADLRQAVAALSAELDANWVPMVRIPAENVGIYITSNPETNRMAGLAMVIAQPDTVVLANIEGRVPISTIIQLASRSDLLPKDLLNSLLQSANGQTAPDAPTPPAAPQPPSD